MIKPMFVVDSDLIIDLLRGFPAAEGFFESIKSRKYLAYFSTITEVELFSGKTASTPEDQNILEELFKIMTRIDLDKDIVRKAGQLRRDYGPSIPDSIIAATALVNRLNTVATRNKKDFEKIKGVKVFVPY